MKRITDNIFLECTDKHIHLRLEQAQEVISSAVLNGGRCFARHVVNRHVPATLSIEETEPPASSLEKYCAEKGWHGKAVGLMTAASMSSFRLKEKDEQGIKIVVMLTSGLDNARCAGDHAEHRIMTATPVNHGTINIIAATTAKLSGAACIEAIQIITEAKVAVLQQLQIKSPVSKQLATGTGTDAVVLINGNGHGNGLGNGHGNRLGNVDYCGKHVLFGELLARLLIACLSASLQREDDA